MSAELKFKLWKEQCSLADLIVETRHIGISIVTCGDCGNVFLMHYEEEEPQCPHCLEELDASDCPDLFINLTLEDFQNMEKAEEGDHQRRAQAQLEAKVLYGGES